MEACYIQIEGNLELPIRIETDSSYISELENTYKKYIGLLVKSQLPNNIVKRIEKKCNKIVEAIKLYYNGRILEAQNCILKILQVYANNDFIVSDINSNYAFRGMAPFLNNEQFDSQRNDELNFFKARVVDENMLLERKDMLHIPFNKRGIIKTQRFSVPGIPCMYLGTSSYDCWLELGKPQSSKFNVSSYKLKGQLKVLNLTLCWSLLCGSSSGIDYGFERTIDNNDIIEACLDLLPLIIATSFVVTDKNRVFKSEHIVSHLIMLCLSDIGVDAVAYISKRVHYDYIAYPNSVNIAIPMQQNGDEQFSAFCREIELTDPMNFEEFLRLNCDERYPLNKKSYIINNFNFNKIFLAGTLCDYRNNIFSEFDNYLISQKHEIVEF